MNSLNGIKIKNSSISELFLLVLCVLILGMFQASTAIGGGAPWYDTAWAKRQPITICHSQIVDDLTDFPVLITETNVNPALFDNAKSDGSDIVLTSGDGVTVLKRELVGFDNSTNKMELYAKVPSLSSTTDTLLYIYYQNPYASVVNDSDTWDSHYIMVQHMEDATSETILGSTINHFIGDKGDVVHSDPRYQVNPSVEVDGKIGMAQEFDRSWINVGVHPEFNLRQFFTVEVWAFPVRPDDQYNGALVSHDMLTTGRQWDAPILMDGSPPQVTLQVRKSGGDRRVHAGPPTYDAWNHIAAVYNFDDSKLLFLNGEICSELGDGQLDDAPNTPLVIGTHYKFNWENHPSFLGIIDEIRISNIARSNAWVLTAHNNQLYPTAFSQAGDEEMTVIQVAIDIKPGSDPNCINNDGHGVIPVAIFSDCVDGYISEGGLDATQINPETVELQGLAVRVAGKSNKLLAHIEDANNDGCDDLVVQIEDQDGAFEEGDAEAILIGNLYEDFGGTPIKGSDSICIVP